MPSDKKKKRRTGRLVWLVLLLLIAAFVLYFAIVAIDRPPVIEDHSSLTIERIEPSAGTYIYDKSWMRKSETGLWELYLEGESFERGVAFGELTRELLYYQETSFVEQIKELVPSDGYLKLLKYFTAFFNRNLDKHITDEYKYEIYGTSFACSPEYDFIGTGYQRQLNYHAAHDIGHALQGLNLVACTAFSVWDGCSADSSLLVGRNFDFYMGDKFAENKIVCFVNPDKGYRFMTVTWADLIGVVSGMNEKGLTVSLNASKSTIPTQAATPVTLLAREILQYASTIGEAYDIAAKRKLFVSESIMVGSARDGMTAIIEKSPDKMDIVYSRADRIISTNHFQGEVFKADEINQENIRGSDSYERYQRVQELLDRNPKLEFAGVAAILRNQQTLGDSDAGMGNQLAINQLIAHHSVIFRPEKLQVWVSTSPWQLGRYVAYDLNKIFKLTVDSIASGRELYIENLTIPADTFLGTKSYLNFTEYRSMTRELSGYKKEKSPLPQGFEKHYISKNPSLYSAYVNLGQYYLQLKDYGRAYEYYREALRRKLPGEDTRKDLIETADEIYSKINHDNTRH